LQSKVWNGAPQRGGPAGRATVEMTGNWWPPVGRKSGDPVQTRGHLPGPPPFAHRGLREPPRSPPNLYERDQARQNLCERDQTWKDMIDPGQGCSVCDHGGPRPRWLKRADSLTHLPSASKVRTPGCTPWRLVVFESCTGPSHGPADGVCLRYAVERGPSPGAPGRGRPCPHPGPARPPQTTHRPGERGDDPVRTPGPADRPPDQTTGQARGGTTLTAGRPSPTGRPASKGRRSGPGPTSQTNAKDVKW
jgi:hypothetical protein